MEERAELDLEALNLELGEIATRIRSIADRTGGDVQLLLTLLRTLEQLHREVCDDRFQAALPNNRQQLYALLREIDAEGGWPYIPRLKLRLLLTNLLKEAGETETGNRA